MSASDLLDPLMWKPRIALKSTPAMPEVRMYRTNVCTQYQICTITTVVQPIVLCNNGIAQIA